MAKLLSVHDIAALIQHHTLEQTLKDMMARLTVDFSRWDEFDKMPRPAFHVPGGVIELMPIADKSRFGFKYVNGHPSNPDTGKQTVVATGQLSNVDDGYPVMISEMTILTALRTAATSALASQILSRKNSHTIAMIGTGAQSDFQVLAHTLVRDVQTVRYHDTDPAAMTRFAKNMQHYNFELVACDSNEDAVKGADIVLVCTACKQHVDVIMDKWITPGTHINGIGGDCPGKTEIEATLLPRAKIVVEFFEQSLMEGEIQRYSETEAKEKVYAELWELLSNQKPGRTSDDEITLFDSVGFALEDFSALCLAYELSQKYGIGQDVTMVPPIQDPKDLFSALKLHVGETVNG
jgi:ornithine cyclodeaminase